MSLWLVALFLLSQFYSSQQHTAQHGTNVLLGEEDTGEVEKLSPAEQKKKMLEIVKRIDRDGDKLLSAEEMAVWIQRVYRKYAMEDAAERFPDFDLDHNGLVSWDEYDTVTHGHLVPLDVDSSLDPEQESLRQLHRREKQRYDFADVDGNAGLNVTEFLAFTHPSEVDHMSVSSIHITDYYYYCYIIYSYEFRLLQDFAIEDVLNEYDSNQDGFISLSEFIGNARGDGDPISQWEIEESVRFKDLYDQDKDGKLNREEQLRWVAPNSYGSAREEVAEFISNTGYEALTQRLNDGRRTCKDLEDLQKMRWVYVKLLRWCILGLKCHRTDVWFCSLRASAEEKYGKELVAIAHKAGGLFEISLLYFYFLLCCSSEIENVGKQHMHLAVELREEVKRMEQFRERQKEQRRKVCNVSSTSRSKDQRLTFVYLQFECVVEKLQKTKVSLYKKTIDSKRSYEQRCRDADEAEQTAEKMDNAPTATPKMIEKVMGPFQLRLRLQLKHKKMKMIWAKNLQFLVSSQRKRAKTQTLCVDVCVFVRQMFQQQEEDRVNILRNAMWVHSNHLSSLCVKDDECYENMRIVLEKCDAVEDNNCFVEMKSTGSAPPAPITFQDYYQFDTATEKHGSSRFVGVMKRSDQSLICYLFYVEFSPSVENPDGIYASIPGHPGEDCGTFRVMYDYTAQVYDELSVFAGDTVLVTLRGDDGWWTVQCNGHSGLVPGSYLSPD
ncbi:hypothetical protein NQD34_004763, partial [Periophthalmus magnuspinnatus]